METVVITGANKGIGLAAAQELSSRGCRLLLVCRDAERGAKALASLDGSYHRLVLADFASLASVRKAAAEIMALVASNFANQPGSADGMSSEYATEDRVAKNSPDHLGPTDATGSHAPETSADKPEPPANLSGPTSGSPPHISALINNAATLPQQRQESQDGFELQLAVTHLAHFLLTHLLLPELQSSGALARVITVSSDAHYGPAFDFADPGFEIRRYRRLESYQQSKLANVLFTLALARRVAGTKVQALALHPGVYDTSLFRDYMGRIPGSGVAAKFVAGRAESAGPILADLAVGRKDEDLNGAYFNKSRRQAPSPESQREEDQERLWEWSSAAVALEALESE